MNTSHNWLKVTLLSLILTISLSMFLVLETWVWFANWGEFKQHSPVLYSAVKGLILGDDKGWIMYDTYLQQSNNKISFVLHMSLPVIVSAICAIYFSFKMFYIPNESDDAIHVDGPILLKGKQAYRHTEKGHQAEVNSDVMKDGFHLHPKVQISKKRELDNIFVFGQQGSGKSVIVKPIIKESINRGDHVLIYDQKREYTALFYSENTILVSPTDKRCTPWNIATDITNKQQALLIAECLISDENENEFWVKGARLIFAGCLIYLISKKSPWGWGDIHETMSFTVKDLKKIFTTHYPPAAKLMEEDSKTTQGFLMVLLTELSWIEILAKAWPDCENGFSISNWVNNTKSKKVLIIPSDPLYTSISGPLCNAIFSLASRHILALSDSDSRNILFALDELGNLPKSDSLEGWLSTGRSKGIRTIAGTQSVSQLHSIYGQHKTETILALFGNVICLRLGSSGQSAKKASGSFGNKIVKRETVSIDVSGKRSTTIQRVEEAVVHPEKIFHLPQANKNGVQGFLCVNGWEAVYQLTWPFPNISKTTEEYVAATWLTTEEKKEAKRSKPGSRGRR